SPPLLREPARHPHLPSFPTRRSSDLVHHLEPAVGGTHKMSFRNFTTGKSHSFGGRYLELVPGERLRYTDTFDDPSLPGEMEVVRSEEHTSELQSRENLVCRLLLEKKK